MGYPEGMMGENPFEQYKMRQPSHYCRAICWRGSTVEQPPCKRQVVGSIPIASWSHSPPSRGVTD